MHTVLVKKLTTDNFEDKDIKLTQLETLNELIDKKDLLLLKKHLPEGFLQRRIWVMNYKTFRNIYMQRKTHRLPHWKKFIEEVYEQLDHKELIKV